MHLTAALPLQELRDDLCQRRIGGIRGIKHQRDPYTLIAHDAPSACTALPPQGTARCCMAFRASIA
jgi:hypothetical protein